jgi:hypothetical protein
MRLVASGTVFDTRTAPANEKSASATGALLASDGTLYVTFRLGTERESGDGHTAILASRDLGETWEIRHLGLHRTRLEGVQGETRSFLLSELEPGVLTGTVLWIDRHDPSKPWVNQETQGLLPMRNYHTTSRDGGVTWDEPRVVDLPYPSSSTTGPLLRLANGDLAQPFEHWKAYGDPAVGRPRALLRFSRDDGRTWTDEAVVAADPDNRLYFWDQRLALHPATRRPVAMFWTFDRVENHDVPIHIAHGSPDGRTWEAPRPTALDGQHCQPIALGGDLLAAAYSHRRNPPGVRVALSRDWGATWSARPTDEIEVYGSGAGDEPNATGAAGQNAGRDYWNAMGAWQFGHPRGIALPNDEIFVVFYAGEGATRSARWARVALEEGDRA